MTYKRGDFVQLECKGQTVKAMVYLASSNGKSLMLGFDAMVDGHVGMMPIFLDDGGVYRSIVNDVEVKLK
jgi:hypothetical protein